MKKLIKYQHYIFKTSYDVFFLFVKVLIRFFTKINFMVNLFIICKYNKKYFKKRGKSLWNLKLINLMN